jgi:hypothetical protein
MARISIPLDASGIEGRDPKQPIKVLLAAGGKPVASKKVDLGVKGQSKVSLEVKGKPGALRVVVGPCRCRTRERSAARSECCQRNFGQSVSSWM